MRGREKKPERDSHNNRRTLILNVCQIVSTKENHGTYFQCPQMPGTLNFLVVKGVSITSTFFSLQEKMNRPFVFFSRVGYISSSSSSLQGLSSLRGESAVRGLPSLLPFSCHVSSSSSGGMRCRHWYWRSLFFPRESAALPSCAQL